MFDRGEGSPIYPSTFSINWRSWCGLNGLAGVGAFHQLRRACSSLMRTADVDLKVISEIMGHPDTRQTEQVYTDVWAEQKREAMLKLRNFVALNV